VAKHKGVHSLLSRPPLFRKTKSSSQAQEGLHQFFLPGRIRDSLTELGDHGNWSRTLEHMRSKPQEPFQKETPSGSHPPRAAMQTKDSGATRISSVNIAA